MIAAKCLDYLQRNFSRPLRVGEIAAELHVGRRTLEKKFREATGRTINAELIRLRIEKATQLMRSPQNSHESIAAACGFYDATHLRVTLRRHGRRQPLCAEDLYRPCSVRLHRICRLCGENVEERDVPGCELRRDGVLAGPGHV